MKILITGSNGQLGTTFKNFQYNNFDYTFCTKKDLNFLNKSKIETILGYINPQIIINCSAYTAVDDAEKNEKFAFTINYEAVDIISKWCKNNGVFFIHFSTDYVFDGTEERPYTENDKPNPLSIYGKTKYYGEQAFLNSKCDGICLRSSWIHSSYGTNFYLTIKNLMFKNEIIKIVDDQFGIPTTTNFLVKIVEKVLKKRIKGDIIPKILHATPSSYSNWYNFGIQIYNNLQNCNNKKNEVKCKKIIPISTFEFSQLARRPKYSVLSNKKLEKFLNVKFKNWSEEHKIIY